MDKQARSALAAEIAEFLLKHARVAADYDPAFDSPDARFNGPDAAMLNAAAAALQEDGEIPVVQSDWSSGCYSPYPDTRAKQWHDGLVRRLADMRQAPAPR